MVTTPADDFDALLATAPSDPPPAEPAALGSRLDEWWDRMMWLPSRARAWTWGVPTFVTLVAAGTRLWSLGHPQELVFDETFYVKDAWSLVNLGYSANWPSDTDPIFASGGTDTFLQTGSYVVHPPLGKWLIGAGMALFGPDPAASWRAATAVVGILAVVLLFFVAKKLFRSTLLAGMAGFLFAIDGNAIVMSRVALLDNFVMFFALLGFGAILLDREWMRGRLEAWAARRKTEGLRLAWGPVFWWRPWLFAAGLAFGLTTAVKWSGLYFLAAFAIYSLVVDLLAHRRAGVAFWPATVFRQGPVSFLLTVPIATVVYFGSWASWFTTKGGYDRGWADVPGNAATGILSFLPHSLQSFWHYQTGVYAYHVGEMRPHAYQANPLSWLLMVRPTSMYYSSDQTGCSTSLCGSSITGIANPLIWWAATAAVFYLCYRLVRFREWRVGLILMGMLAGYVPWLLYLNRTVFQFYTIAFEPYMILALTLAIGILLGSKYDPPWRRENAWRVLAVFFGLAIAISVFFWPLWTGMQIDYNYLRAHWWLPSWR